MNGELNTAQISLPLIVIVHSPLENVKECGTVLISCTTPKMLGLPPTSTVMTISIGKMP